jgi:hypothetical protein
LKQISEMPSIDQIQALLTDVSFGITVYAVILSLISGVRATKKLRHYWKTRHLQKVWGFKNGDAVILVCSELDEPAARQNVEAREFIYSLKYGDVDAYFEIVVTLLRLYPSIKLRIMSAGEAETTRLDISSHLVVIGGPDYNPLARRALSWDTQFKYRSPYVETQSTEHPSEIVIFDQTKQKEYCHTNDTRDYGYFERIPNPHNPDRLVVLLGGCHTIGVTGAAKAFSTAASEDGEIPPGVLKNAKLVAKKIKNAKTFSVLVETERFGQTISTPVLKEEDVTV